MLTGKKIIIGITGSIAAYKTPLIVRELIREVVAVALGLEIKFVCHDSPLYWSLVQVMSISQPL